MCVPQNHRLPIAYMAHVLNSLRCESSLPRNSKKKGASGIQQVWKLTKPSFNGARRCENLQGWGPRRGRPRASFLSTRRKHPCNSPGGGRPFQHLNARGPWRARRWRWRRGQTTAGAASEPDSACTEGGAQGAAHLTSLLGEANRSGTSQQG
jgi:hypothetical protein